MDSAEKDLVRQLLMFIDELVCEISQGRQVGAIIMDFSKAFDVEPHGQSTREDVILWH